MTLDRDAPFSKWLVKVSGDILVPSFMGLKGFFQYVFLSSMVECLAVAFLMAYFLQLIC